MNKQKKSIVFITQAAIIAALYASLTLLLGEFSFGPVQFRVSEALTILPYFTFSAVPGLFVGCFIANLFSGSVIDMIIGPLVTLLAALLSYLLKKHPFLVSLPPFIFNTLIIPFVLKYAYHLDDAVWFIMLTVGVGELVCCCFIGTLLLFTLKKYEHLLFRK